MGGTLCIGSECFSREPIFQDNRVPVEYNFKWNWNVWDSCYSKYHCPNWWKPQLTKTNKLDIQYCEELEDGRILFEDLALNYHQYVCDRILSLHAVVPQEKIVDQIISGSKHVLIEKLGVWDVNICLMLFLRATAS